MLLCKAAQGDGPHVAALFRVPLSGVLDFSANNRNQCAWRRGILEYARVSFRLHYLDLPNDMCKQRLRARIESGTTISESAMRSTISSRTILCATDSRGGVRSGGLFRCVERQRRAIGDLLESETGLDAADTGNSGEVFLQKTLVSF